MRGEVAVRGLGYSTDVLAITDEPHCGWYKRKFDRSGVFVPARIWLRQVVDDGELIEPEKLLCEIGGEPFDPDEAWLSLCGHPITRDEFDYMMRVRDWATSHARNQPEAQPLKPIDLFTVKPPIWGKRRKRT